MKTQLILSSGREVFLHSMEPIKKQPISGLNDWLAALRSGKYNQTTHRLHDSTGFCCLGVKRDLEGCSWTFDGDIRFIDSDLLETHYYGGNCGLNSRGQFPCYAFLSFEKLDGDDIPYHHQTSHLAELNDEGFTFAEIADIIEQLWTEK